MPTANCTLCKGEINTESSPSGKCVRCLEAEKRQVPLPVVGAIPAVEHAKIPDPIPVPTLDPELPPKAFKTAAPEPASPFADTEPSVAPKHEPHAHHGKKGHK